MRIDDIGRWMDKTRANMIGVGAAGLVVFQLVPANSRRIALIIGPPDTGAIFISPQRDVSGGGTSTGIRLTGGASSLPLVLNWHDHGDLVRLQLFGMFTLAANIGVIEVIWDGCGQGREPLPGMRA